MIDHRTDTVHSDAVANLDEDDLLKRALRAYYRSAENAPIPSSASGVEEVGDRAYVRLFNCNGTLAVYRVGNDGTLRRLRRWPAALERP